MNSATFKTYRETLGLEVKDLAAWMGVDRKTVQRWENPQAGDVPAWAARKMLERWDRLIFSISSALEYLDQQEQEQGSAPEAVEMRRFKTDASCQRVNGLGTDAKRHAISVGIIAAALQAGGYETRLDWVPVEP